MNPIDQSIIGNNVLEALENSGRIGKSKVTTITFDGEITGKPFFDWGNGMYIVKISDIAVPIENVKMASVKSGDNNVIGVPKEQMSFIEEVSGFWGILAFGEVFCWICYKAVEYEGDNYEPGVYAIRFSNGAHITSLVAETIHPIDQKFIPGAVLPVVELSTTGDMPAQDTLTEDAVLVLINAVENGTPLIARASLTSGSESLKINMLCSTMHNRLSGSYFAQGTSAGISVTMEAVNGTGAFAIESMV